MQLPRRPMDVLDTVLKRVAGGPYVTYVAVGAALAVGAAVIVLHRSWPLKRRRRRTKRKHIVQTSAPNVLKVDEHGAPLVINQYSVSRLLGKGSFGQVYEATDESGETVAIKVLDRSLLKRKHRGPAAAKALEAVTREIAVMKKIEDPGVVLLFDVFDDPTSDRVFLVMELLEGGEVSTDAAHTSYSSRAVFSPP